MKKKIFKERAAKPALSFQRAERPRPSGDRRSRFKLGEILELRIEKLVWGGAGLARTDRGVIFVDFTAPGDLVRAQVSHIESDYARAKLQQIVEAAAIRIPAPCPVFGRCGGCDWQHLSVAEQLRQKHLLLMDALNRQLNFAEEVPLHESPKVWQYRNRIQIHLDSKGPYYHSKRSHEPVYVRDCPIADPRISQQLRELKALPESKEGQKPLVQRLQLSIDPGAAAEADGPLSFEFAQVNSEQNQRLVDQVIAWSHELKFERFFDLYSGSGNFSFPLGEAHNSTVGTAVELNPQSVHSAQLEARRRKWGRQRIEFFAASVDALLPRLPIDTQSLILLDPPRTGVSKSVGELLAKTQAAGLFYVSCDPPSLVRDLKRIMQNSLWKIRRIHAFDMFPQTAHLEVLVELSSSDEPRPGT